MIARLARLAGPPESDARLLGRFAGGRDEAAFRALLDRHAGLVLGVCRRALGHAQDAEDAFQATFLVLARQAARVRRPDALGCWLYGVARPGGPQGPGRPPPVGPAGPGRPTRAAGRRRRGVAGTATRSWTRNWPGCRPGTAEPVVLCGLEDLTQEEAAARLGCPVGTVKSRLARGRELLRARLARRGITPAVAGTALVLAAGPGPAAVPVRLVESTMAITFHPAPAAAAARLADAVLGSAVRTGLAAGGGSWGSSWPAWPGQSPWRAARGPRPRRRPPRPRVSFQGRVALQNSARGYGL